MRKWKVTGTKHGKPQTVVIEAADHNEAVRIASKRKGLLLVVRDCVLVDDAKCGECGAVKGQDKCGRSFMPGRCPVDNMKNDASCGAMCAPLPGSTPGRVHQ